MSATEIFTKYVIPILIVLPSVAFLWHYLVEQRTYKGEPPLEAGKIPWLGVGLEMRDNMEGFVLKGYAKHGHTFAAMAAGQRFIFTQDLNIHKQVVSSKDFGLNQIMVTFHKRFVFADRGATADEETHFSKILHTQLTGKYLAKLREDFLLYLIPILDEYRDIGEVDFLPMVRRIIFVCTSRSMFGPKFPADEAFPEFMTWDNALQTLMSGGKNKEAVDAYYRLEAMMDSHLKANLSEASPVIQAQFARGKEIGTPWHLMVKFTAMSVLWAGAANITPVGAWAAAYVYRDPALQAKLRKELSEANPELEAEHLYETGAPSAQLVAEEAIRLTMLGSLVRPVISNGTTVSTREGELRLRKGDLVMCTSWSLHRRYDQPEEFIYDRMKDIKASKQELLYYPFGGGPRPCPGRMFAYSEIKMLVLCMLERFDVEPLSPFPDLIKKGRLGVGPAEASHSWKVRLLRR